MMRWSASLHLISRCSYAWVSRWQHDRLFRVRSFHHLSTLYPSSRGSTFLLNYPRPGGSTERDFSGRPDEQAEDAPIPKPSERAAETWLVVGDGDLSYSAQLARELYPDNHLLPEAAPPSIRLVATVWEDQATHHAVYRNSVRHTQFLAQSLGDRVQVKFEVDATQLSTYFEPESLDRIIFNFPHWKGKANIRYSRQLVREFLHSAAMVLHPQGQIHLALFHGQGGMEANTAREWRQSWLVTEYAAQVGLALMDRRPFVVNYDPSSYRGADRPFMLGSLPPWLYVLARPRPLLLTDSDHSDGEPQTSIPPSHRMACRHELRLVLDQERLASECPFTYQELVQGEAVLDFIRPVAHHHGLAVEVPIRDVVVVAEPPHFSPSTSPPRTDESSRSSSWTLLVCLVVYSGQYVPLTRALADATRAQVEKLAREQLKLDVAKSDRIVSKVFPYAMLDHLLQEYRSTATNQTQDAE